MRTIRIGLFAVALAAFLSVGVAGGVDWPNRPVEIVVPSGAGGDPDFLARLFARYLSEDLKGNFVVSNVPGNGGATGTRKVKDASPDGSMLVFYQSAAVMNKLSGAADYGFEAFDLVCIAGKSRGNIITVNSGTGFKTIKDLIDYTKKHPGEMTIAAQTGATTHATALLLKKAGADLTIVDSGSSASRVAAILGGHVDVIINPYGNISDYIKDGSLSPIGTDGLTDFDEIGVKCGPSQGIPIGYDYYYYFAFPKGTDPAIVRRLSKAVENIIMNNKEFQEKIYTAYFQKPFYADSREAIELFKEVEEIVSKVNFKE
jgi:tripartite-type tricarboxylate transporter receptor subunit TctC